MVKNSTGMYDLFYHLVESRYVFLHGNKKLYSGEPPPTFKKRFSSRTDLQEF